MIHLMLLGNVELTADDAGALQTPLRHSKRVALLAFLGVARPAGYHRRDKLAALFWPELPADRARAALRTTISRLRDDFGAELILGRGSDEIAADLTRIRTDVLEFDAAILARRFDDAVRLYRGPFLDGVHVEGAGDELEDWLVGERARLRDALLCALSGIADGAEHRGELAMAVTAARRALDVSPYDEILARRLVALLVASGNRGGAMHVIEEFVRRLREDLDVEPAEETKAIVESLRTRLVSSGEHPTAQVSDPGPANAMPTAVRQAYSAPSAGAPPRRQSHSRALLSGLAVLGVAGWIATRNRAIADAAPLLEWHLVTPSTLGAAGAFGARAVLDSTGDALLVFGGVRDVERKLIVPLGDVYWRLRGFRGPGRASWMRMEPAAGEHPAPRWLFGASSDAPHDRVLVHGGALGFTSPCANDTWLLSHASGVGHIPVWDRVRTRGRVPPLRAAFDQVFDASRRRLIVFAGNDCFYPNFQDTWVLAFDDSTLTSGTWSVLVPDTSAGLPVHRDGYVAAYDTSAARLYVFGGRADAVPTAELWALEHAAGGQQTPVWHQISCAGDHPPRLQPASAIDHKLDTWTFFGGEDSNAEYTGSVWRLTGLLRDTDNCRWEQMVVAQPSPAARVGASAAVLPGSRGIVIYGGDFQNNAFADAWILRAVASSGTGRLERFSLGKSLGGNGRPITGVAGK